MRELTCGLLVLFATGCATQIAVTDPFEASAARDDARARHEELVQLDRSVAAAIEDPNACGETLCPGASRICELSERICAIAERHPEDDETGGRCRDAEGRCETARERVAGSCTCAE